MERDDLASLAGFFCDADAFVRGGVAHLDVDAAHHIRVRRLAVGDRVYVANGRGLQAIGVIARLGKRDADVSVEDVMQSARPGAVHVIVPIADRDRMLWCAEKCAELGATSWRPVMFTRSRSVSPRGEGPSFGTRIRGRMESALIQSHSPWLCDVAPEAPLSDAIAATPVGGTRVVLDVSGAPIAIEKLIEPVTIAVGPEGGFERDELQQLRDASFRPVSLGANVLRFETAVVAALAIARVSLATSSENARG